MDSLNFGTSLGRSEMKKIMAGSGGPNVCHCYCCDSGGQSGSSFGVTNPCGGSHDDCQSECKDWFPNQCQGPGEYICALCQPY